MGRDGQKCVHGSPVCELKYPVYRYECAPVDGSHCECVDVFDCTVCVQVCTCLISLWDSECVCVGGH